MRLLSVLCTLLFLCAGAEAVDFTGEIGPESLEGRGDTSVAVASAAAVNAFVLDSGAAKPTTSRFLATSAATQGQPDGLLPPVARPLPLLSAGPRFNGFRGLTNLDQRTAGNGAYTNTQFSSEPPDQALAVGNNFVIEGVNTAFAIYDAAAGARLSNVIPYNQFFRLAPSVRRGTNPVFGPFLSDPRAYYDVDLQRWFMTILEIDTDPATGKFAGKSHVEIAVSKTPDPRLDWYLYQLETTSDGDTEVDGSPICPCFGDQPLIGADYFGFFISTNSFSIARPFTTGAQVYALSKTLLARGIPPTVVRFGGLTTGDDIAFSVHPARNTPFDFLGFETFGTEYFLSSLDPNGTVDNRLAVWAITNTSSLDSDAPSITLQQVIIASEAYGQPPQAVDQKPGDIPLGTSVGEGLLRIDANDDRMNQVVLAQGLLWSGVNTVLGDGTGKASVYAGIAYFGVRPGFGRDGRLRARVERQGYISLDGASVIFPSVAFTLFGQGVIAYTAVGPDLFPSAAYSRLNLSGRADGVRIAAPGNAPDDGFGGYKAFGGEGVGRWGDYSAATADEYGNLWVAMEYIPDAPRSSLENWGTFVGQLPSPFRF